MNERDQIVKSGALKKHVTMKNRVAVLKQIEKYGFNL